MSLAPLARPPLAGFCHFPPQRDDLTLEEVEAVLSDGDWTRVRARTETQLLNQLAYLLNQQAQG